MWCTSENGRCNKMLQTTECHKRITVTQTAEVQKTKPEIKHEWTHCHLDAKNVIKCTENIRTQFDLIHSHHVIIFITIIIMMLGPTITLLLYEWMILHDLYRVTEVDEGAMLSPYIKNDFERSLNRLSYASRYVPCCQYFFWHLALF